MPVTIDGVTYESINIAFKITGLSFRKVRAIAKAQQ